MPVLLFSRQLKGFWVGQIISTLSTSFTVSVFSFEPPRQSILCHNKARQPYRFPSSPTKYEWLPSQFVSSGKTYQQWYAGCASTMHPLPECSLAVERCMPYIVGGRECNCLPEKFNMFYIYSSIPISSFDTHIPWCFRETVNPVTHDFSVHQSPNILHISRGLTNLQFDMGSLVTMYVWSSFVGIVGHPTRGAAELVPIPQKTFFLLWASLVQPRPLPAGLLLPLPLYSWSGCKTF